MISSEPGMRRRRSSESGVGTIRSWSPLTMSVVAVIRDRSEGAERPYFLMASSCVRNIPIPTVLSRSTVRSCKRCMNSFAAVLPAALRLKNRNSFGSARTNVARRKSRYVSPATLSMSLPPRGPVPVSTSLRTRPGCARTRSWAMKPPHREREEIDGVEIECRNEGVGVRCHRFDRVGNLPG